MLFRPNIPRLKEHRNIKKLIKCLNLFGEKNAYTRLEAEIALKELGEISIPYLIDALDHWSSQVRQTASSILGEIGDDKVVPVLIDLLNDEKDVVVSAAVSALGKIGDPSALDHIIKKLNIHDPEPMESIYQTLGRIGDKRAIYPILSSRGNLEMKRSALIEIGKRDIYALIGTLAGSDLNIFDRELIFSALGDIGDQRAIKPLVEQLRKNNHLRTYKIILEGLRKLGWKPESELENAWELLYDNNFKKLISLGPVALQPLLIALDARDETITKNVVKALGNIRDKEAVKPLIEAVDHNPDIREDVVEALAKIAGKDAIAGLFVLVEGLAPEGKKYECLVKKISGPPGFCSMMSFQYAWDEWSKPGSKQEKVFQLLAKLGKSDYRSILIALQNSIDVRAFLAAKVLTHLDDPAVTRGVAYILKRDTLPLHSLSAKWAAACFIAISGDNQWTDIILDFLFTHHLQFYNFIEFSISNHFRKIFGDLTNLIMLASSYYMDSTMDWDLKHTSMSEEYQIYAVKKLCRRVTPLTTNILYSLPYSFIKRITI